MSAGPNDLHNLVAEVLAEASYALDSLPGYDATLEGAPDRQFVSPGTPVQDFVSADCCSQLAAWAAPINEADTSPGGLDAGKRSSRFAWINQVGIYIGIDRCIPGGEMSGSGIFTPPAADTLTEVSRQYHADAWVLWNYLHEAVHAARLLTLCDEMFFDTITPSTPTGGCCGWVVSLRAALGGFSESLGS